MKKMICLAAVLLICFSLAAPVLASEDIFVPSITYKNGPDVGTATLSGNITEVTPGDSQGTTDGQTGGEQTAPTPVDRDVSGCVIITSIIQAQKKTTDIYEEDRQLLLDVYEDLTEGDMDFSGDVKTQTGDTEQNQKEEPKGIQKVIETVGKLFRREEEPTNGIEVHNDGTMRLTFDNNEYVIKELVDVSFVRTDCVEDQHLHKEALEQEGVRIDVDFDLGVSAEDNVAVLHYHEGVWSPITKVVNNGDGTLTCTFEHFCPVAFCLETEEVSDTAQGGSIFLWVIIMLLALAALIFLVTRRKKVEETA